MSDNANIKRQCADDPEPFRLPFISSGDALATICPADGFLMFMPDGNAPGVYVTMGGKFHRLPTEQQICEMVDAAVKKIVGAV